MPSPQPDLNKMCVDCKVSVLFSVLTWFILNTTSFVYCPFLINCILSILVINYSLYYNYSRYYATVSYLFYSYTIVYNFVVVSSCFPEFNHFSIFWSGEWRWCHDVFATDVSRDKKSRTLKPMNNASLGWCDPWTSRPLDVASHVHHVSWTSHGYLRSLKRPK
jgi:hypothetical protein